MRPNYLIQPGTMSIERRIVLALIKIPITAWVMLTKVSKRNSVLLKTPRAALQPASNLPALVRAATRDASSQLRK
jgi:hypothetical protein